MTQRHPLAAFVIVLALVAVGCVSDTRPDPETCAAPQTSLSLTLADDRLTGDELSVCRGQQVVMEVAVEQDGVLHIHGYDDQAVQVRSGQPVTLEFDAVRSGQFPVELHTLDVPDGVSVGIFTVHEP